VSEKLKWVGWAWPGRTEIKPPEYGRKPCLERQPEKEKDEAFGLQFGDAPGQYMQTYAEKDRPYLSREREGFHGKEAQSR